MEKDKEVKEEGTGNTWNHNLSVSKTIVHVYALAQKMMLLYFAFLFFLLSIIV